MFEFYLSLTPTERVFFTEFLFFVTGILKLKMLCNLIVEIQYLQISKFTVIFYW